jgi:hypothetical protein
LDQPLRTRITIADTDQPDRRRRDTELVTDGLIALDR